MPIRRLHPADATAYRALRLRALREHPVAFTTSAEEAEREPAQAAAARLAAADAAFFGAFEDGVLCGMVGYERERRAKARHKATVVGMYVAPEAGGRGIGRELLDTLVHEARHAGLELLVLTVTEGEGPARRLYEAAGFRAFGLEPRAVRVDGRAWGKHHMALELTA